MRLTVVDAFTDRPFSGNPAAVTLVDAFPPAERMQLVAREMNLSETAFVVRRDDDDHDLRWFTPAAEVNLCGHATLAAAHVLGGTARFHTASGILCCERRGAWIEMSFPAWRPSPCPLPHLPAGFPEPKWTGIAGEDWLVELASPAEVVSLVPDLADLAALGRRCVVVTALGRPERGDPADESASAPAGDRSLATGDDLAADIVSRVFCPNVGIPEDPVTGSAHCALAPYWAERLGRPELTGYQASARGGLVRARLEGDRVVLAGEAVTMSEVELLA